MANNPVRFADPLGDTVRGFSAQSAQRMLSTISKTFAGDKGMKSLFTIGKDGKTFNSIGLVAFAKATENLSSDKLALATAYMMAINGSSNQVVSMVTRSQSLGSTISNLLPPGNKTGADIDNNMGGGVNIPYGNNGTLSIIVTNSTANIPDFVNSVTGGYSTQNSSAGELISHEMLGHGMGRVENSPTYGHEDAIQMTNMFMRSQGSNLYRDGTSHGTQVQLSPTNANSIPQMYRGAVFGTSLLQGATKLIDKIFGN